MYFSWLHKSNKHPKQVLLENTLYLSEIFQNGFFIGIGNRTSQRVIIKFCDILYFKYKRYKKMLVCQKTNSTKVHNQNIVVENHKENSFVSAKQSPEKFTTYNHEREESIDRIPLTQKNLNQKLIIPTKEDQLTFLLLQQTNLLKIDNLSKVQGLKIKLQKILYNFQNLVGKLKKIKESYSKRVHLQTTVFNTHIKQFEMKFNKILKQKSEELDEAKLVIQEKDTQIQELNKKIIILQSRENKLKDLSLFSIPIGKTLIKYMTDTENDISFDMFFRKSFPKITSFSNIRQIDCLQKIQEEIVEKLESFQSFQKADAILENGFVTPILKQIDKQGNGLTQRIKILHDKIQNLENKQNYLTEEKNMVEPLSLLTDNYSKQIDLNNELRDNLTNVQNILKDVEFQLRIELANNNELKENVQLHDITVNNLSDQYNRLQGDLTQKLHWNQLKGINRDSNKWKMDLERIEMMSHVELQNIVKQLVMFLDIPLNKIKTQLIKIGISLKYERNLSKYFIGKISYQLTGQPIDFNKYQKEAFQKFQKDNSLDNIVHPLQAKLDTLLDELLLKL